MRYWQLFFICFHQDGEGRVKVFKTEETGSFAGGNKFQEEGLLFLTHLVDDFPEQIYIFFQASLVTLEASVIPPISNVDDTGPGNKIVELSIVEHFDPLLVDDLFKSLSDEPGLPVERTVHFVVNQQVYILHFVRTV